MFNLPENSYFHVAGKQYDNIRDAARAFLTEKIPAHQSISFVQAGIMVQVAGTDADGKRFFNKVKGVGAEHEATIAFEKAVLDEEKCINGYYMVGGRKFTDPHEAAQEFLSSDKVGTTVTLHSDYFYGHSLAHVAHDDHAQANHVYDNIGFRDNRIVSAFKSSFDQIKSGTQERIHNQAQPQAQARPNAVPSLQTALLAKTSDLFAQFRSANEQMTHNDEQRMARPRPA